jgi:hypothetical protein
MGFGTLIQRITYRISGRSAASSGLYTPQDYLYDYAVGGVPFLSATSDSRPDTEKPVQQRKQQFDNYKDPGEYSLNQWWLRSQTSFVGGAGVLYQDPDTQGSALNTRFNKSIGIDPFSDSDVIKLLRRLVDTGAVASDALNAATFCTPFQGPEGNNLWLAKGRNVWSYIVASGGLTLNASTTLPSSGIGTQEILDGIVGIDRRDATSIPNYSYVYYLDTGSAANTGIWQITNGVGALTAIRQYVTPIATPPISHVGKAKGLLAFSAGNKLYMLDPYAAANTALPAANAAVPLDQTIVAVVDGPDGVYVAANSGTEGYIYRSTFDASGVVNGLTATAVLPIGERINSINTYVNTYIVIATETGIRVGTFGSGGVVYSPSPITVASTTTTDPSVLRNAVNGFGRIAFYGTKAYVATLGPAQHDGYYGLMAVDLSTINSDQTTGSDTNAYCTWTYFPGNTNRINDVCVTMDGRTVQTTGFTGVGHVYLEHSTELIDQGYLDTGRCRFNTVEPKLFKYFSIRTPTPLGGDLTVTLLDDAGGATTYITYGPTLDPGTNDIATPTPGGPRNWEALRFTLKRGATDLTVGATLDSWQIKALPGTLKQRVIVRQFLCFNAEKDKSGQLISGDTSSLDRLTAVRQMCQRGDTVTLQDLVNNISDQVIIDDYDFMMMAPPGPNGENYGGYLTVTMRTVADSVPPISVSSGSDDS